MKRLLTAPATVALVLGAFATPAAAAPSGCTGRHEYKTYIVACTTGDGAYRAWITCMSFAGPGGMVWRSTTYGPWAAPGPGSNSAATCGGTPLTAGTQFG
ncbi:hypothetical protein FDA94_35880 [Herbidospora galbida]|uniref:Uncharacterized protein n=1 Tax=Herbidospora galbida TaxID=2575442 RepID=A0A4U3M089_9ACTN|nr:hypothetical protein [Herbidospora galbida]TKK80636.1 hypothetical protein FDA94_35880 [Herbidospora galbida]